MAASLPPEILFLILDKVQKRNDIHAARTRCRLLQVCRHWHEVLFTTVYSQIDMDRAEELVPFAEALQRCPRLRPAVRELLLGYAHNNHGYLEDSERTTYNRALFHDFLSSFAEDEEDLKKLETRLSSRHAYSWVAVVLISLPNLQGLGFNWGGHGSVTETTLWAVSKIADKSPNENLPLQHLRQLMVSREQMSDEGFPFQDEDYRLVNLKEMTPFLRLPSLEEIKLRWSLKREPVRGHVGCVFNIPFTMIARSSNLRELRLRQSSVMDGMYDFIAVCAHLEVFEYQHSCHAYERGANGNYRCRPFRAALLTQRESLRSLRLNDVGVTKWFDTMEDHEYDSEEENDEEIRAEIENERRISALDAAEAEAEAWFGSLAEFVALKELRIPVRNILDSKGGAEPSVPLCELLPSSIETLILTKVDMDEYSMLECQLRGLLSAKEQKFPNLRKVMLLPFQMEYDKDKWGDPVQVMKLTDMAFMDVGRLYEEQGLEFGFLGNGDFQVFNTNGDLIISEDDVDSCTFRDDW